MNTAKPWYQDFFYGLFMTFQVDGSQRKLFKNGRDLEDALTAAVIRNLKIVQVRIKELYTFHR